MNKKNQVIATSVTVIVGILLIWLIFSISKPSEEPTRPVGKPTVVEPEPEDVTTQRIAPAEESNEAQMDTTTLEFEKTVKLEETFTVDTRFKDYSLLPSDFDSYEDAVAELPIIPGKVTITFRKFEKADRVTILESKPDYTLYYITYNYSGHPDNPTGERIMPDMPFSGLPDMAPQPVIVVGDKTLPTNADSFEIIRKALGLSHPTHMKFDKPTSRYYGAVWERPSNRLPIVALEYIHTDGERRLIRLEY